MPKIKLPVKPLKYLKIKKEATEEPEVLKETQEAVLDLHNPGFDPDIPEQKQRWLR